MDDRHDAVPLRDYIDARFRALEASVGERFRAVEKTVGAHESEMNRRESIHQTAHASEHRMTEQAIDRARLAMDERIKSGEAAHTQTASRMAEMLPRAEFATAVESIHREMGQADKLVSQGRGMALLAAFLIPVVVSAGMFLIARM